MDNTVALLIVSLSMFIGCLIAGIVPLAINFSKKNLKYVTVLGAGLLVGTALAVILPEGVHAMYSEEGRKNSYLHELEHLVNEQTSGVKNHSTAEAYNKYQHDYSNKHSVIGISLVTGFVFMMLVDHLGSHVHLPSEPADEQSTGQPEHHKNNVTATVGLVVHAAADGVALGAAISLSDFEVTAMVFAAIMLHKMPAAFGLVLFLHHDGFTHSTIYIHLAIFSFAAPLLTIITYVLLIQNDKEDFQSIQATGIAMLFSAGTFLYVATVHILPEIATTHVHYLSPEGTVLVKDEKGLSHSELFLLIIGCILPMGLTIWHKD